MPSHNRGGSVGSSNRGGGSCSGDGGCDWNDIHMGVVIDAIEIWQEPEGTLVHTGNGVSSSGPLEGSQFTGFLLGENIASKLSLKEMKRIRQNYDIPDHISLHVPSKEVRADWDLPGMTCLYELPFKLGFQFPLTRLIWEVCDFYEIAPGQLVPNAWRLLMALEVFCEMREIPITIKEVRSAYALKPTNADKGRLGYPIDPLRESIKNWIEYFVSLDEEDRKVENILTEANLRNNSLWKSVPPIPKD
ncbi:hypothetical protein OROMI_001350 [Orobanche minor]